MTIDRRHFLAGSAFAALAAACRASAPAQTGTRGVVRVASVKTAVEGTLLPTLIERWKATSPVRVELQTGVHVYDLARKGEVDLVVSHFGHKDAETFILDGLGEWPRTIFSNQMALVGVPSDPAGIRGVASLEDAFRKIIATKSKLVMNDIDGVRYLTDIVWHAIGKPDRSGWLIDDDVARGLALESAVKHEGYTMWGLTPFLRTTGVLDVKLEPMVVDDPLLQRLMVSVIVKRGNVTDATAFQAYLLAPETQAAIRTIAYPTREPVQWVPAGRHNRTGMLPKP